MLAPGGNPVEAAKVNHDFLREITIAFGHQGEAWLEKKLLLKVGVGQILFLSLVIAAMFASPGRGLDRW